MDQERVERPLSEVLDVKKNATYSLPVGVWLWLKDEAERRNTDASALLVDLIVREKDAVPA